MYIPASIMTCKDKSKFIEYSILQRMDGMPEIHKLRALENMLAYMMNGDDDYRSTIPCYYTPVKKQEKKAA